MCTPYCNSMYNYKSNFDNKEYLFNGTTSFRMDDNLFDEGYNGNPFNLKMSIEDLDSSDDNNKLFNKQNKKDYINTNISCDLKMSIENSDLNTYNNISLQNNNIHNNISTELNSNNIDIETMIGNENQTTNKTDIDSINNIQDDFVNIKGNEVNNNINTYDNLFNNKHVKNDKNAIIEVNNMNLIKNNINTYDNSINNKQLVNEQNKFIKVNNGNCMNSNSSTSNFNTDINKNKEQLEKLRNDILALTDKNYAKCQTGTDIYKKIEVLLIHYFNDQHPNMKTVNKGNFRKNQEARNYINDLRIYFKDEIMTVLKKHVGNPRAVYNIIDKKTLEDAINNICEMDYSNKKNKSNIIYNNFNQIFINYYKCLHPDVKNINIKTFRKVDDVRIFVKNLHEKYQTEITQLLNKWKK